MKVHKQGYFGLTYCGRTWSGVPLRFKVKLASVDSRKVTCRLCRKKMRRPPSKRRNMK